MPKLEPSESERADSAEAYAHLRDMVESYRASCFWDFRPDFRPTNLTQARAALRALMRRGDRNAYIRAREIERWLFRHSTERS